MGLKNDRWIRRMSSLLCPTCGGDPDYWKHSVCLDCQNGKKPWQPMIEPFAPEQVRIAVDPECSACRNDNIPHGPGCASRRVISYGLSSYGYDLRVANEFRVFTPVCDANVVIDPKAFDPRLLRVVKTDRLILPAHSFCLALSVEHFRIPRGVSTDCIGKSTYARCGILLNVTPFEPEWEGRPTLEITNPTPVPCVIYAWEGIGQVRFFEADEVCETSYADRGGKYQGDTSIQGARV